jgi:hypothetical protein
MNILSRYFNCSLLHSAVKAAGVVIGDEHGAFTLHFSHGPYRKPVMQQPRAMLWDQKRENVCYQGLKSVHFNNTRLETVLPMNKRAALPPGQIAPDPGPSRENP